VRAKWERTERTAGGSAPALSDDEIVAVGTSVREYVAVNPLQEWRNTEQQRMEIYSDVAAIISEATGMPYDPALQDAGFASEIDAFYVTAFKDILAEAVDGGLCPVPDSGPASMPCISKGCLLFVSPWSVRTSAQEG
jgi:hypothetical protein